MIDIVVVFVYLAMALIVGIFSSKNVDSSDDYKTGGRQYSSWIIFMTLSASFIGGGFTLGLSEKTFLYGFIYILAILGFSLKEILIAFFVVPHMQSFRSVLTAGDIMKQAFGVRAKIITGIFSILVCGGCIGAQISACGHVMHIFLGPPPAIGALLAASIVIIYATLGGMRSVIAVDVLHFIAFSIIISLVFCFGLHKVGGLTSFFQALPSTHLIPESVISLKDFLIIFFTFFLGETLFPPYVHRLFIGRTNKETKNGTLYSGIFSIYFLSIVGCIGMIALQLEPEQPAFFALPYVIQNVMPIGLKGLAIAAIFAVIMSSIDSFLNSITTTFFHDILEPLGILGRIKSKELFLSRLVTFLIGLIAVIISITTPSALDVAVYSYQFWTPCILIPLLAAIFKIRSSDKVFMLSSLIGFMAMLFWNFFIPKNPGDTILSSSVTASLFGLFFNVLTFAVSQKFFNSRLVTPFNEHCS
jgi:SSS family solute:Na+ symporter